MPTNVKTSTMTFPYPLGRISPGAPGRSVALTSVIQPVEQDGVTPRNHCSKIVIQADPGNTGDYIYITTNANAPDTVNYSNIIAKLLPGSFWNPDRQWSNSLNLGAYFIGIAGGGNPQGADGAIVSFEEF